MLFKVTPQLRCEVVAEAASTILQQQLQMMTVIYETIVIKVVQVVRKLVREVIS
jgi:hypothetical protein